MRVIYLILSVAALTMHLGTYAQQASNLDTIIVLKEFEIKDMMGKKIFQPATRVDRELIGRAPARDIGDLLRSQPNISGVKKVEQV